MLGKSWVSSGDEEQVQPLSHSQGGGWPCVLCIPDSLNEKSALHIPIFSLFSDPSAGTVTGCEDQVLSRVNLSWGALGALAEDMVGCSGPDALGESMSYSCVLHILGMRERTIFPVPHAQKEH